jgi:hypothetical protein
MEPRDMPAVLRLCAAQNRRDGTSYPVPLIFDLDKSSPRYGQYLPNVALALVTTVDGRVKQGHVFMRTVEAMSFGGGRDDMEFSCAHIPLALELLRCAGYDEVHTFVPHGKVEELQKVLKPQGLKRIDQRLAHFFKVL